jgi:catechol 2,3-dioxygenase-like lactoylglutathione lyase family enzyme
MAKLRHVAISVPDLQKAAAFYEEVFDMERVRESKVAVNLSDGVMNITLLRFPTDEMAGDERGKDWFGVHHIGFQVDDPDEVGKRVVDHGGIYMGKSPGPPGLNAEDKYRDPDGVVFDLSEEGWVGTS